MEQRARIYRFITSKKTRETWTSSWRSLKNRLSLYNKSRRRWRSYSTLVRRARENQLITRKKQEGKLLNKRWSVDLIIHTKRLKHSAFSLQEKKRWSLHSYDEQKKTYHAKKKKHFLNTNWNVNLFKNTKRPKEQACCI